MGYSQNMTNILTMESLDFDIAEIQNTLHIHFVIIFVRLAVVNKYKYRILYIQGPNPSFFFCLFVFLVINSYTFFVEIKSLIRTYLAYIANNYPKTQEPILPDFEKCRFLHARFYCNLHSSLKPPAPRCC